METIEHINTIKKYTLDLSLWLDDYNDIYSDFDSRSFPKRRISSDFIDELRIAMKNKKEGINDLVLLLPSEKRDIKTEQTISSNLKSYFTRQLEIYTARFIHHLKKGIILFLLAISLMVINTVISFGLNNNLLSSIIRIVLEPSGWFLIWVSFDILYYDLKSLKKEKNIFRELAGLNIFFQSSDSKNIS